MYGTQGKAALQGKQAWTNGEKGLDLHERPSVILSVSCRLLMCVCFVSSHARETHPHQQLHAQVDGRLTLVWRVQHLSGNNRRLVKKETTSPLFHITLNAASLARAGESRALAVSRMSGRGYSPFHALHNWAETDVNDVQRNNLLLIVKAKHEVDIKMIYSSCCG